MELVRNCILQNSKNPKEAKKLITKYKGLSIALYTLLELIDMIKKDTLYQNGIDEETKRLLSLSVVQFKNMDDYDSLEKNHEEMKFSISWWHHQYGDELEHIYFKTQRRLVLRFFKTYIGGAKLEKGKINKLTDEVLVESKPGEMWREDIGDL